MDGTPPNLFNEIKGDAFAPRNKHALAIDFVQEPPFFQVSETHAAKTWYLDPRAPKIEDVYKRQIQSSPQRLSDGSAVVLTVAKLVCGDGSCFDGTGLTVDVERPLTADEQTAYYDYTVENDPQIQRAVSTAQQMSGTTTVKMCIRDRSTSCPPLSARCSCARCSSRAASKAWIRRLCSVSDRYPH